MNISIDDLRPTIIPKSDQLNAEQLLGGPMTITVTEVRIGSSDEQPISIHYENDSGRPYKPSKTQRKVLLFAWGADGRTWIGRSMTLFNDPTIKFGGAEVGGIRISHISDIERDLQVSLTATKGKKALHVIKRLVAAAASPQHISAIESAKTVKALKDAFAAAYSSSKDAAIRATYKRTYDARTAALSKTPAARTLQHFKDDIDNAVDSDTATLALDAARDDLDATDLEALGEHYRARWVE